MQIIESFQETGLETLIDGPRIFATTHWGVVQAAGQDGNVLSDRALEMLCTAYWRPIYGYVRRRGHGPDDAQDLTQEFFSRLIAKQQIRLADRNKGKFRTFLLAMLHQFLAQEWTRAHRQKRGGHCHFISIDQTTADDGVAFEPMDGTTPEKQFERQWALTVLQRSMTALSDESAAMGKERLFREVQHLVSGERDGSSYSEIAQRLHMAETAVRVAVHRLRQRYGQLLRTEVAQTVHSPSEIDDELRFLLCALSE